LNGTFPRQSNSTSDHEIFRRRRRQTEGRFFNINGPASPSGPTIFLNGSLPLRCVHSAVADGLPLACNEVAPGGGCGSGNGFGMFHVPPPFSHGDYVGFWGGTIQIIGLSALSFWNC
jgi:hypothetical protein